MSLYTSSAVQGWGAGALEPSIFAGAGAFLNISCGATKYLSAPALVLSIANFNNFLSYFEILVV